MEKKQLLPIAWGAAQLHAKLSGQIGIWESIFLVSRNGYLSIRSGQLECGVTFARTLA